MKGNRFCVARVLVTSLFIVPAATADGPDEVLRDDRARGREFRKVEMGDRLVYFHQRAVGGAVVEKDFIVYQFNRRTNDLVDKRMHWRFDVPDGIEPLVTREQAASMVEGEVETVVLYIISPDSDVFPLDPAPENPCWVVRSIRDGELIVTIIDAVTGCRLGYGVPPPQTTGFAMSGPWYSEPCGGAWTDWYTNAAAWFESMGYPTTAVGWPDHDEIRGHVQSHETAVFYEIGHSHGTWGLLFCSGCPDGYSWQDTTASDIEAWIAGYSKMPFTFLASCYGMCDVGPGTLSHAFRKGSAANAATVGYCDMSESYCSTCWGYSLDWQTELFGNMANGDTVKEAYDKAMAAYAMCAPIDGLCMRFAGDESFAIVPVVPRDACANVAPQPPPAEAGYVKNRSISMVPGNPGRQTALRVTLTDLPAPFEDHAGTRMWVGPPGVKCENAGQSEPPLDGCASAPGLPIREITSANLQCTPNCTDYGSLGVLHVTDKEIVPSAIYEVRAIDCECDFDVEANYSAPLSIFTSRWGDLIGDCTMTPCTPPDGVVNVSTDVTACLDKFKNLSGAVAKARADVEPNVVDWRINITDVTYILDAFRGLPYPFDGPGGCP